MSSLKEKETVSKEESGMLLIHFDKVTPAMENEIIAALKGGDVDAKVDAMNKAIMLLSQGNSLPQLLPTIVRYVLHSEDHRIQQLLLVYSEIIRKTDANRRVLPGMISFRQQLRSNLLHPVDSIRWVTLRFLCFMDKTELIEPLIPFVLQNLEHHHPNVRWNAILVVLAISKLPRGEQILVDTHETIGKILSTELDPLSKLTVVRLLLHLTTARNINAVVQMLKKEVVKSKTKEGQPDKNGEYRRILLVGLYCCAVNFPKVARTVVYLLMDFLGDSHVACDVVAFVGKIVEKNSKLRLSVITRLLDELYQIRAAPYCSCFYWRDMPFSELIRTLRNIIHGTVVD